MGFADVDEGVAFEKEDQIVYAQVRTLQRRTKKEEAWDRELDQEEAQAEALAEE